MATPSDRRSIVERPPIFSTVPWKSDVVISSPTANCGRASRRMPDAEFSIIDQALETKAPALVKHLKGYTHHIGEQGHNAWHWLRIHSGHGGAVEEHHFEWAVEGVRRAFAYLAPDADHAAHRRWLLEGFAQFATDHALFFDRVAESARGA